MREGRGVPHLSPREASARCLSGVRATGPKGKDGERKIPLERQRRRRQRRAWPQTIAVSSSLKMYTYMLRLTMHDSCVAVHT